MAGSNKFAVVMREFAKGKLHSGKPGPGKGPLVRSSAQAKAIAAHEAGLPRKK